MSLSWAIFRTNSKVSTWPSRKRLKLMPEQESHEYSFFPTPMKVPIEGSNYFLQTPSICDWDQLRVLVGEMCPWLLERSKVLDQFFDLQGFKGRKCCHTTLVSEKMCWSDDINSSEFILVTEQSTRSLLFHSLRGTSNRSLINFICDSILYICTHAHKALSNNM